MDDTERDRGMAEFGSVRKNFIFQKPFTRTGPHRVRMETKVVSGEVVQFILCETEGDRPVGSVYFRDIDRENNRAEYGIFIGEEDAAGKGYGTLRQRSCLLRQR